MGRDNHGCTHSVIESFEQPQQLERHIRIDIAGWLIGNENLRARNDSAGNCYPLLLPT